MWSMARAGQASTGSDDARYCKSNTSSVCSATTNWYVRRFAGVKQKTSNDGLVFVR